MIRRIILLILITIPTTTYANITITEIMYDLPGVDSKMEWVEIYNESDQAIDISLWRFNDGSNHEIKGDDEGVSIISSQSYVIIASDRDTFLSLNKEDGIVFDTVMSLNNTEDTISLIDENGEIVDSVTYTNELGAQGDGNSLQLDGLVWKSAPISLFSAFNKEVVEEIKEEETINTRSSHIEPYIKTDAGEDIYGVVSAPIIFRGHAVGLKGEFIKGARFLWNFGDGEFMEGQSVSHTYLYPGSYRVSLTVSSGEFVSSDRLTVDVRGAEVEITFASKEKIEISNYSDYELDLSFWKIQHNDKYFHLPNGTFIEPKSVGIFPAVVTNIFPNKLDKLSLLYPNGLFASSFVVPIENKKIENLKKEEPRVVYVNYTPKVEEKEKEIELSTSSVASVVTISSSDDSSSYIWLLSIVIAVSVLSLIFLSKDKFVN